MSGYSILKKSFKTLYTACFPYACLFCGNKSDRGQELCQACFESLPPLPSTLCHCCSTPLTSSHTLCGTCLNKPPLFHKTHVLYAYESPISELMIGLKFRHQLTHARLLGELLAEAILHWYPDRTWPEVILPVPLHKGRLKERGFNQALEIARPISRHLGIPIDTKTCIRIKPTLPQATLPAKKRPENIKNAFQVLKPIPYQSIAVLDDVMTTGQTVRELCKTLVHAGVKKIDIWCCAKPIADDNS